MLLLLIDTCGATSSVALSQGATILAETTLDGRNTSATVVPAIDAILKEHNFTVQNLEGIAVTSGPGSFTGIRIGLSVAKGLAVARNLPLVAISRLTVLAHKANTPYAALDAHRNELFFFDHGTESLIATDNAPTAQIAICEDTLANRLPDTKLITLHASDMLPLALPRFAANQLTDPTLLDGHYLRRSDAEILLD